jgi:hypothetical protein
MNLFLRSPARVAALLILTAAVAAWQSAPVKAALPPIVWGSPQTVSGDSDVSTNGSLVYALTFGGTAAPSSATVNGVTFSPFTIPGGFPTTVTVGSVTLTESPGFLLGSNSFGTASTPFSGLSTDYKTILGSGAYANEPTSITVSLNGLANGQDYEVQWWTNNAANITPQFGGGFTDTTATAFNTVTLDANTTNTVGGLGQYAIGTFTASGTTQAFLLSETSGGFNPLINAMQVRAVPEPSLTLLGLAAAVGGSLVWRRRSRSAAGR